MSFACAMLRRISLPVPGLRRGAWRPGGVEFARHG
jgi:hypothetical protein